MIPADQELRMVRIEDGSAQHLVEVMDVMNAAFDGAYGEAWTRPQCAGILPMSGVRLRLARLVDGSAAGFSLFRTIADEAELLLLATGPEHRRAGIGRRLLDDFVLSAAEAGATRVHLEVRANNPAFELYSSAGFSPVGRRRNYYTGVNGDRFDALTLARAI